MTTCRDEILAAVQSILARSGGDTFTLEQVLHEMGKRDAGFKGSTIRTHVTSRMCASSPDHHAKVYDDFERVDRGVYRLRHSPSGGAVRDIRVEDRAPLVAGSPISDPAVSPLANRVQTSPIASGARIGLVGCVKSKLDHAATAADLYVSPLFRGRRAHVESTCDRWFILSALHGLVRPDAILEPYDVALKSASRQERRVWAANVLSQLDAELGSCSGHTFEVHAGANYADYGLVTGLRAKGAIVEQPCAGLGMGRQLAFYAKPGEPAAPPERQENDASTTFADLDESPALVRACDWPADVTCLDRPGLYAWWVDESGAVDLSRGLGLTVASGRIYAGQAGATFWPSGKVSDNTLGKRIGQKHLGGKVRVSTFRHTLAAILFEQIDVHVMRSMRIAPASENALSAWMHEHLLVAVHPHDDRDTLSGLEHAMLRRLDPPLNLSHMLPTPVRTRLKALRKLISGAS